MKFCEFKKMYFLQNDLAAAVIVLFFFEHLITHVMKEQCQVSQKRIEFFSYVNFQQQRF